MRLGRQHASMSGTPTCCVGIVSKTDALPFGEMRKHWQAAALDAFSRTSIKRKLGLAGLVNPIAEVSSSAFQMKAWDE